MTQHKTETVVKIEDLRALILEMEKYKFQTTTLHEIRTFTLAQRPIRRESESNPLKKETP